MRGQIPPDVADDPRQGLQHLHQRGATEDRTLSNGEEISARLVVLANGLNVGLRHTLGIRRRVISECHSITLGFDVEPVGRQAFSFPALTYWPKGLVPAWPTCRCFRSADRMRANLMVYRDMTDPWLQQFKQAPEKTMCALMPGLQRMLGEFSVNGPVKIRPADLFVTEGYLQPGIVLAGDAFSTSCPAAGTGTTKVFTDVGRLCNVYIPQWLATEGMDAHKVAAFYDDPEKVACETRCLAKAYHLRSLSIDNGLSWRARRGARFVARLSLGVGRSIRKRLSAGSVPPSLADDPDAHPGHSRLA